MEHGHCLVLKGGQFEEHNMLYNMLHNNSPLLSKGGYFVMPDVMPLEKREKGF